MTPKRILIVDDDEDLARILSDNFTMRGFQAERVSEAAHVIDRVRVFRPDLVLLDIMLAGPEDGFLLSGTIRQGGRIPVIMLTARDQKADKLRGLAAGADDYITKPFDFDELLARVGAVLRRARLAVDTLRLGKILVDFRSQKAWLGRRAINLTHREFDLLAFLAERQGRVVLRDEILRELWGWAADTNTRAVDYAILRLRRKIERNPHHPQYIQTAHGDGYCLTVSEVKDG